MLILNLNIMLKRILVALDVDSETPVATKYAIDLARKTGSSLTGLALVDVNRIATSAYGGGIGTIYYSEQLRKHMTEETSQKADELLAEFENAVNEAGVPHSAVMREGVPHERIIEDMKYHDLLVLGRDSHYFYSKPDQETRTLARFVKNGNAPALVVSDKLHDINKVLVAFDGSGAAARTLQWFIHLQPYGKDIAIELVNINPNESEDGRDAANLVLRLAEDYLKVHGFSNISKTMLSGGRPGERLIAHQKEVGSDLILAGAHSISAIRRVTFGSTTYHLITECKNPLFMSH